MPLRRCNNVDLPDPRRPTNPMTSPGASVKVIPSSADKLPKRFDRLTARNASPLMSTLPGPDRFPKDLPSPGLRMAGSPSAECNSGDDDYADGGRLPVRRKPQQNQAIAQNLHRYCSQQRAPYRAFAPQPTAPADHRRGEDIQLVTH